MTKKEQAKTKAQKNKRNQKCEKLGQTNKKITHKETNNIQPQTQKKSQDVTGGASRRLRGDRIHV